MTPFERYLRHESEVVRGFAACPFWAQFRDMGEENLLLWLLQFRQISLKFIEWYQSAGLAMMNPLGKQLVRHILGEEVSPGKPTHQEDLVVDLVMMGIPLERIVRTSQPSDTARECLRRLAALTFYPQDDYDLRVAVTLRVAGELLVSEQCRLVAEEMVRRFEIPFEQSRFYVPHWRHDAIDGSHSLLWVDVLRELIVDDRTENISRNTATAAQTARLSLFGPQYMRSWPAEE